MRVGSSPTRSTILRMVITNVNNKNNVMKVEIEFDVNVKEVEGNMYVCHIPTIDVYFGAKNKEMIKTKAKAMINVFCSQFNLSTGREH